MAVLSGRAINSPVDELLSDIPQTSSYRAGFSLSRSSSGSTSSSGTEGSYVPQPAPAFWRDVEIICIISAINSPNPVVLAVRIYRFREISNFASRESGRIFPPGQGSGGKNNALRHAIWQTMLTCEFGPDKAAEIGDIHEDSGGTPCDSAVDQENNCRARNNAENRCKRLNDGTITREQLAQELKQAVEDGEFITDPAQLDPPCNP